MSSCVFANTIWGVIVPDAFVAELLPFLETPLFSPEIGEGVDAVSRLQFAELRARIITAIDSRLTPELSQGLHIYFTGYEDERALGNSATDPEVWICGYSRDEVPVAVPTGVGANPQAILILRERGAMWHDWVTVSG